MCCSVPIASTFTCVQLSPRVAVVTSTAGTRLECSQCRLVRVLGQGQLLTDPDPYERFGLSRLDRFLAEHEHAEKPLTRHSKPVVTIDMKKIKRAARGRAA